MIFFFYDRCYSKNCQIKLKSDDKIEIAQATGNFYYGAESLKNLSLLFEFQGKYDEAERLFRRTTEIYEKPL